MKVEDMKRLTRAERSMVRLMCCVGCRDGGNTEEVYKRLNIVEILEMVNKERLKWFGHVMRNSEDEWISRCKNLECDGVRDRGQSKKTWEECSKKDLRDHGLKKEWALDRDRWRGLILGNRPTRVRVDKRT